MAHPSIDRHFAAALAAIALCAGCQNESAGTGGAGGVAGSAISGRAAPVSGGLAPNVEPTDLTAGESQTGDDATGGVGGTGEEGVECAEDAECAIAADAWLAPLREAVEPSARVEASRCVTGGSGEGPTCECTLEGGDVIRLGRVEYLCEYDPPPDPGFGGGGANSYVCDPPESWLGACLYRGRSGCLYYQAERVGVTECAPEDAETSCLETCGELDARIVADARAHDIALRTAECPEAGGLCRIIVMMDGRCRAGLAGDDRDCALSDEALLELEGL